MTTDLLSIARQTLAEAITKANLADDAFDAAIKVAGYKSRWDWSPLADGAPKAAYLAKVRADETMHEAFEMIRAVEKAT